MCDVFNHLPQKNNHLERVDKPIYLINLKTEVSSMIEWEGVQSFVGVVDQIEFRIHTVFVTNLIVDLYRCQSWIAR